MQPLGRKPSRFPSKQDVHPAKGFMNWWEAEGAMSSGENKAAARRAARKEIEEEVADASGIE